MLLLQAALAFVGFGASASDVCRSISGLTSPGWREENHELIDQYVRMNTRDSTHFAIWLGAKPSEFRTSKWYLDAKHEYLDVVLFVAIARNQPIEVSKLIREGADVNSDANVDDYLTPLITAVRCSSPEVVKKLIQSGAKVNAEATYSSNENIAIHGAVALIWASERGDLAILDQLFAAGANPNVQERIVAVNDPSNNAAKLGTTSLLTNPSPSVMSELLSHGANPNAVNSLGESPLMLAAEEGSRDKCTLLLKNGADKTIRNADGETAAQLAKSLKHYDLAEIIESYPGVERPANR
jgi:ankyrin repeat protein